MPRFDVTTFGEGQLRFSVPAGRRLKQANQFDAHAVCTCANVTGLLARLGWSCGWISSLPTTPLGRRVANEFRLAGLDLSAVVWSDKYRLATYYVEYAVPPRSTQVYYDRSNTCFANLTVDQIDWDYLLDTRLVHLYGWLQGDFARGLRYGALTAALALSQYGDQVITTSQEVETLLESDTVDISR